MYSPDEIEALDFEYSPSKHSKRLSSPTDVLDYHCNYVKQETQRARNSPYIKCDLDIPYGDNEDETVDIYQNTDGNSDAPLFLFIHGGYWQCLSKNDYGHCALALTLKSGYRVMIANYSLCPKITLQQLVNQAKNLIQFCLQFTVNTNAKFLSIAGHSAGAHLILAALSDLDFVTQNTLSLCSKLKHLYLISGVYDLSQLRFVPSINKDNLLSLTDENVKQLSPYFCDFSHLKGFKAKFYFVLGEHESDTFKRQSHEMMEILLNNVELDTEYEVLRGLDHFSIIENLNLENFYLVQKLTEDNREPDPSNCEIVTKYSSSQLESRYGDESQNEFVVFSKSSYVK